MGSGEVVQSVVDDPIIEISVVEQEIPISWGQSVARTHGSREACYTTVRRKSP